MTDREKQRWLDAAEQRAWLALVGVVVRLPAELDRQLQRDAGITHFEYQVLAALSDAPDRTLRMSALAERTEGSLQRLSQVVTRLQRRGWVDRRTDPTDGRYTLATLAEPGWDKLVSAAPGHVATVRNLAIDPLSGPQLKQLRAISTAILDAIDAAER